MSEEIKPIPTAYKGITYRSRLEARWKVFFEAAGLPVAYEPEGFMLDHGFWYLPDFHCTHGDFWIEIKPHGLLTNQEEYERAVNACHLLACHINKTVLLIIGYPNKDQYQISSFKPTGEPDELHWNSVFGCGRKEERELWLIDIEAGASTTLYIPNDSCDSRGDKLPMEHCGPIESGYTAAMSEKFGVR